MIKVSKDNIIEGTNVSFDDVAKGAIVEEGSNENGRYIKYANGLMICTLSTRVTNQAISQAYGSMYIGTRDWAYPHEFRTVYYVGCSQFQCGTGASFGAVQSFSTILARLRGYDYFSRAEGANVNISAIAIGTWK